MNESHVLQTKGKKDHPGSVMDWHISNYAYVDNSNIIITFLYYKTIFKCLYDLF